MPVLPALPTEEHPQAPMLTPQRGKVSGVLSTRSQRCRERLHRIR